MFSVVLLQFPILWKLFDPRSVPRNRHFAILILSNLEIVQLKHFSTYIIISPSGSGTRLGRKLSVCLRHGIMGRKLTDGGLLRYRKWVPQQLGDIIIQGSGDSRPMGARHSNTAANHNTTHFLVWSTGPLLNFFGRPHGNLFLNFLPIVLCF